MTAAFQLFDNCPDPRPQKQATRYRLSGGSAAGGF